MEAPSKHRSTRMRHLHEEDDSLVSPRRPNENLSLDVDSSRHSRAFHEEVMSDGDTDTYNRSSQPNARFFIIGGFCCFLFLLATVTIYSSLNEQNNNDLRAMEKSETSDLESEDEVIEEEENLDVTIKPHSIGGVNMVPGHVTEGGDVIGEFFEGEGLGDSYIIPEIELISESELKNEENSVIAESDGLSDITAEKGSKDLFIMDINGDRFEIGIGSDGNFDLPDGLILNPHVRQHWALIQTTLGLDDYGDLDEKDETNIGLDGDGKLGPSLPSEDDLDLLGEIDEPAVEGKVRMPEGLLFQAPPVENEHVHGEGCDPVSVDVKDSIKRLGAGDKLIETAEAEETK